MKNLEGLVKPSYLCQSDDPKILELSLSLSRAIKEKEEKVKNFFYWVRDEFKWNIVPIVGAKKLLERNPREAICLDKVNLFNALCKAIGVPARYVFLVSCNLKAKVPDFPERVSHAASQIFINNEWKIVDPTFGIKTQNIVEISEWDKPSWNSYSKMMVWDRLNRKIKFLATIALYILPSAKKMKDIIKRYSTPSLQQFL